MIPPASSAFSAALMNSSVAGLANVSTALTAAPE